MAHRYIILGSSLLPTVFGWTWFPLHHCSSHLTGYDYSLRQQARKVHAVCILRCQVDEEPDPVSLGVCGVGQPPQGLKRKAETPLGSPPEPGQVLQQQDDDARGGRFKIRVKHAPG